MFQFQHFKLGFKGGDQTNSTVGFIFIFFGGGPVLKVDAHGAHVRRTKESWEDQKAG